MVSTDIDDAFQSIKAWTCAIMLMNWHSNCSGGSDEVIVAYILVSEGHANMQDYIV